MFSTNIYAYPSDYSRTVPPITQQYSTWCWVADGLMAERYFSDSSVTQSQFYYAASCVDGSMTCIKSHLNSYSISSTVKSGTLTFSQIESEIYTNNKLIIIGWIAEGTSGHVVLAKGFKVINGVNYVVYNDSSDGQSHYRTYDYMCSNSTYTWQETLHNIGI